MLFKALLVTAVLASIGVPRPREAEAQDCGTTCHSCGLIGYEGRNYSQDGRYNMTCPSASIPYCVACPEVELVADGLPSATVIADELRGASAADIRTVADRYRDRLVVNEERGLLVIRGTSCDPEAIAAVLFLKRTKLSAIAAVPIARAEEAIQTLQ